jgi:hypothetical protein
VAVKLQLDAVRVAVQVTALPVVVGELVGGV